MKGPGDGFLWLASYPKSGNTWFRVFHTNLVRDADKPADINELLCRQMASSRVWFDDYAGVESSDLLPEEIERLRPRVYELAAAEGRADLVVKVHDAFTRNGQGEWLFPPGATRAALYILRNPLDVAVSFAHHLGCGFDKVIGQMADPSYCLCRKPARIVTQLRQRLLTWSDHVTSWVDGLGEKLHLLRYEDMVLRPVETFLAAARFAGLPDERARVEKALLFSQIEELQAQERRHGFREKCVKAESFFRKGKIGAWRECLSGGQVERIIRDHRSVMERFGYLDDRGEPVF